jgi:hypothetical protein
MPTYKDKDDFNERFFFPVVRNTYKHLKMGGTYALNIPIEMYEDIKPILGTPTTKIPLAIAKRGKSEGRLGGGYKEYIYVWKKTGELDGGIKIHPAAPDRRVAQLRIIRQAARRVRNGERLADVFREIRYDIQHEENYPFTDEDVPDLYDAIQDAVGRDDDESTVEGEAEEELEGGGWLGDLFGTVKKYVGRVADVVVRGKRQDYPPRVRELLKRIGDRPITSARLRRDPIQAPLNTALNLITLGKWEQAKRKYAYDKLFHLGLEVTVDVSTSNEASGNYVLEKNEVINIAPAKPSNDKTETLPVNLNGGITINQLLEGAKALQGGAFFNYTAVTNKCQDFIIAVLRGSGLATPSNTSWVKQPVSELVTELPSYTSKIANIATDLGAYANVVLEGRGGMKPRPRFAKQLKDAGVSPEAYLMEAQKKAEDAGLAHKLLGFSDDDKHKLQIPNEDGRIVRFGAVGLGDYILYTLSGDKSAEEHQKRYLARATKIKGKWREDAYSQNCLAINVLW